MAQWQTLGHVWVDKFCSYRRPIICPFSIKLPTAEACYVPTGKCFYLLYLSKPYGCRAATKFVPCFFNVSAHCCCRLGPRFFSFLFYIILSNLYWFFVFFNLFLCFYICFFICAVVLLPSALVRIINCIKPFFLSCLYYYMLKLWSILKLY